MSDIEDVPLGKDQRRVTTTVENPDGRYFTKVEIVEPDPGAGMNSTGMRTTRTQIVARGVKRRQEGYLVSVVPSNDLVRHHTHDRNCVCGPSVQLADGKEILVHQALDGRE